MEDLKGQITRAAADIYESFFVPALFREWAPRLADAAGLAPGQRTLDVACGTGVLALECARRVRPGGSVAGLDRNAAMLDVARRHGSEIEWRQGVAEALPFADASFDATLSQFGLMFFDDQVAALREMQRVTRPRGRLVVAVWDGLDRTPGYAAMTALLNRLFGPRIANELRAPYSLGDADRLRALFDEAGSPAEIMTVEGQARFPSLEAWVRTDVKGWTLAQLLSDAQYETLRDAAERELRAFVQNDDSVVFRHPALIVVATSG